MTRQDDPDNSSSNESTLKAAFLPHDDASATPARMSGDGDNAIYRTLLESTKAIPWKIDWATMEFAYIGPQIEALLGWPPSSWKNVNDWAERMHPEDRGSVVDFCVAQSKAGTDHEADYRALTRDGGYVWLRDVVHVVRNAHGDVDSLVGFMFDISERKRNEEKLARLQKELERLSFRDSLTDAGNRRMFDTVMEREWAAAKSSGMPLSLIMVEAAGPDSFLARFGGEEFILVLSGTPAEHAVRIAERCRALILEEAIAHVRSPHHQRVTASFGVGTIVPTERMDATAFVNLVDAQLYQAKDNGRNRIAAVDHAGIGGEAFKSHSR
jgi:PAS domain S-box-containing protein